MNEPKYLIIEKSSAIIEQLPQLDQENFAAFERGLPGCKTLQEMDSLARQADCFWFCGSERPTPKIYVRKRGGAILCVMRLAEVSA